MLLRFEPGITNGRCGRDGPSTLSGLGLTVAKLLVEPLVWYVEGGVELPGAEFRVEEDLVVGTVPLDSLDDPDVPEVRKLARDRLRRSLKKVIANEKASTITML